MLILVGTAMLMALKAQDKKAAPEQKATGMQVLSPTNTTQFKAVFYSGDPWLIQCGSKADLAAAAAGDVGLGAHNVLEIAMLALAKLPVSLGLLDCEKKLPSGKSTLDRFKLDGGVSPMFIFAANGLDPVQIVPWMLAKYGGSRNLLPTPRQQAAALVDLVKSRATPQAFTLTESDDMHAHCLKRKHCVLWLTEGEPQGEAARTLGTLLREYRTVAFGTVNTARYQFSLAKALSAPPTKWTPQVLAVRSTAAEGDAKKVTLAAKAYRGEPTLEGLRGFVSGLADESLELTPLTKPPALAWRKQAKEAAKDGKEEGGVGSKRSAKKGSSSSSSGSSTSSSKRQSGKGSKGIGSGGQGRRESIMSYEELKAAEEAKAAAAKGGGTVDEVKRRRRMALKEEEDQELLRRRMALEEESEGEVQTHFRSLFDSPQFRKVVLAVFLSVFNTLLPGSELVNVLVADKFADLFFHGLSSSSSGSSTSSSKRQSGKGSKGIGSGGQGRRESIMSYEELKAAEEAKAAAAKGGGTVDEVKRRRRMALKEEEDQELLRRRMALEEESEGEVQTHFRSLFDSPQFRKVVLAVFLSVFNTLLPGSELVNVLVADKFADLFFHGLRVLAHRVYVLGSDRVYELGSDE
jgi:hypothetical protein